MSSAIFLDGQGIEKEDFSCQAQSLGLGDKFGFHVAIAVDVEFGIGNLFFHTGEGIDGDIETLMPLKAAGEDDDEFVIGAGAGPAMKDGGIHLIDEHGTLGLGSGALCKEINPKMVGNDDVMGKGG